MVFPGEDAETSAQRGEALGYAARFRRREAACILRRVLAFWWSWRALVVVLRLDWALRSCGVLLSPIPPKTAKPAVARIKDRMLGTILDTILSAILSPLLGAFTLFLHRSARRGLCRLLWGLRRLSG